MKDVWHDIETGPKVPEVINVIVEIPKGSQNKYEFDKKNGLFKLDRVLFSPVHYPGDYGLVPKTLCDDGDPLDAIVLVTEKTFPGILIEARPIGMMNMIDSGEHDEKILCVPVEDPRFSHVQSIKDISQHTLSEIAHFFQRYKELQGKHVEIGTWEDADKAKEMVLHSIALYKKKKFRK